MKCTISPRTNSFCQGVWGFVKPTWWSMMVQCAFVLLCFKKVRQDLSSGSSSGCSQLPPRRSDRSGPVAKNKKLNVYFASFCWILTYYVNEVDWCCGVQVPVQLVQNDPLHAKNLRCWKVASALQHQVSDRTDDLLKHKEANKRTVLKIQRRLCLLCVFSLCP